MAAKPIKRSATARTAPMRNSTMTTRVKRPTAVDALHDLRAGNKEAANLKLRQSAGLAPLTSDTPSMPGKKKMPLPPRKAGGRRGAAKPRTSSTSMGPTRANMTRGKKTGLARMIRARSGY